MFRKPAILLLLVSLLLTLPALHCVAQTDTVQFSVHLDPYLNYSRTNGVNFLGNLPLTDASEIAVETFSWSFEWHMTESINEAISIELPQYADGSTASPDDVITIVTMRRVHSYHYGNSFDLTMQLSPGGDQLQFSGNVVVLSPEEEGIYPAFDFCTIAFRPAEVGVANISVSQIKSLFKAMGGQE